MEEGVDMKNQFRIEKLPCQWKFQMLSVYLMLIEV